MPTWEQLLKRKELTLWQQVFAAEQDKLPRDATPQERGRATRRAAVEYRAIRQRVYGKKPSTKRRR